MHLLKRKRPTTKNMDMTPMIDITFLLIIFFVTVSRITDVKTDPQVEVPKTTQRPQEVEQAATIIINVTRDADVVVSGESVSIGQLVTLVGQEMLNVGDNPTRLKILLRVDRRGTSRKANEVVEALNELGVTQVRIALETSE